MHLSNATATIHGSHSEDPDCSRPSLIKGSSWQREETTMTPTRKLILCVPDGDDVGEQEEEADDLQVPATSEVLKGHHDQRHHHQSTEEDLREAVHLQVKQADLGDRAQRNSW